MPVKLRERHIAGVGHSKVVPHLAARQRLGIAPLGDGDAQVGGFVVVGQLDDLARILQGLVKHGVAELPIGRGGHFNDFIPPQGQGFGRRHASGVGGDVIHHLAGPGLADLIHRPLQGGACRGTGDLVVLGSILADLELPGDGGVLPLDLRRFPGLDVDGLVLLVQLVAGGGLQFTNIQPALALNSEVVDVNIALVVRGVLADGVLVLIVD